MHIAAIKYGSLCWWSSKLCFSWLVLECKSNWRLWHLMTHVNWQEVTLYLLQYFVGSLLKSYNKYCPRCMYLKVWNVQIPYYNFLATGVGGWLSHHKICEKLTKIWTKTEISKLNKKIRWTSHKLDKEES